MNVVRIGTSEKGGTFWSQGEAVARLLRSGHGLECQVLDAVEASIENARKLEEDRLDFGFMASNWIGRARNAEAPFENPVDIRMVAPANSGAMFFIVREDSSLRTIRDMIGHRVAIGPRGSGMVQHVHTIFGALGIGFDEFEPVYLSFAEGGAALEAGDVDAQWQCPYPNPVMRDISERFAVRVLNYDPADLDEVLGVVDFYRPSIMAEGTFRGIARDTRQVAVVNVIAAHARTDAEIVRRFVSTMLDNLDELAAANPLFRGLGDLFEPLREDGVAALEFGGVPLHAGAVRACRDAGYID